MRAGLITLIVAVLAGCSSLPPEQHQTWEHIEWGTQAADARIAYETAMDYLSRGRQQDAEQLVVESCPVYPDSQRLLFLRAVLERSRSNVQAACGTFAQVYELGADTWQGQVAKIMVAMDLGAQSDVGFDQLEELIDDYPDELLIRWLFAIESVQFDQHPQEGARQFQRILEEWKIGPVTVHHTYALLLTSGLDRPEDALDHVQLAAELEPQGKTYQGLAFTLYRLERYTEADQVFGKLLEMEPENALFWFQWGSCLAHMGQYAAAADKFEKTYMMQDDPLSLVCWGRCLELLGKPEAGFDKYALALEQSRGAAVARAYVAIGSLYGYGTPCSFERALDICLGANGPAVDFLRAQVQLADESDNPLAPEKSGTLMKHLVSLAESDDPEAQYSLAMIYRHGIGVPKDTAGSEKWLERATDNGFTPIDPTEAIQGTWTSDQSVAVYEISLVDGQMTVSGHSSFSGREMVIDDVSWDGSTLEFTSYMPATDRRVEHINRLVNRNTMESTATGETSHTVIWKKNR